MKNLYIALIIIAVMAIREYKLVKYKMERPLTDKELKELAEKDAWYKHRLEERLKTISYDELIDLDINKKELIKEKLVELREDRFYQELNNFHFTKAEISEMENERKLLHFSRLPLRDTRELYLNEPDKTHLEFYKEKLKTTEDEMLFLEYNNVTDDKLKEILISEMEDRGITRHLRKGQVVPERM